MKCSNCGTLLETGSNICGFCGYINTDAHQNTMDLNKVESKGDKKPRVFCSTSFRSGNCPVCGSVLTAVEYCSAIKGATTLVGRERDYLAGKVTTTTSTEYSDVRQHSGEICLNCLEKAGKPRIVLNIAALFMGLIGAISTINAVTTDLGTAFVVISLVVTVLSWGYVGFITKHGNHIYKKHGNRSPKEEANIVSICFVERILKCDNHQDIPAGRIICTPSFIRNMKK